MRLPDLSLAQPGLIYVCHLLAGSTGVLLRQVSTHGYNQFHNVLDTALYFSGYQPPQNIQTRILFTT
jgi:hypothetical protein